MNVKRNTLRYFICAVMSINFFGCFSQKNFQYYEKALTEECSNCTTSQMNDFLLKRCFEKDSIISVTYSNFSKKINNKMANSDSSYRSELVAMHSELDFAYEAWNKLKKTCVKSYASLANGGTIQPVYYGLMYWMISDQQLDFLRIFMETAFGG